MESRNKIIHTFVVLAYQESKYLEECIKSVLNQKYKSFVKIATTTDNEFIKKIAQKYKLDLIIGKHTSIGGDFDFALKCAKTPLVTIAHQDDIYDFDYSQNIVNNFYKNPDALILFTDYYEIRENKKVYKNTNLNIKRILLTPLKPSFLTNKKFAKRFVLRFGNAISCPAVTFNREKVFPPLFDCDMRCDVDWFAWETLSRKKGRFVFISKCLMGHRIHEDSETSKTINDKMRTVEDLEILKKFWPKSLVKVINKFYSKSEKSNNLK